MIKFHETISPYCPSYAQWSKSENLRDINIYKICIGSHVPFLLWPFRRLKWKTSRRLYADDRKKKLDFKRFTPLKLQVHTVSFESLSALRNYHILNDLPQCDCSDVFFSSKIWRTERSFFASPNWWRPTVVFTAICTESTVCSLCWVLVSDLEENSAYHTLVCLKVFEIDRETLGCRIGTCSPHDLVHRMLESPATWEAVVNFTEAIIGFNEEADRVRDNRARRALPSCSSEGGRLRWLLRDV